MSTQDAHSKPHVSAYHAPQEDVFGSNAIRLSPRQCVIATAILLLLYVGLPNIWTRIEPLNAGAEYRIPYALSEDYWLYARYANEALVGGPKIPIVGDSVIWGQYVKPNEALSCALNNQIGHQRFVNLGLNGSHPAALAGLLEHFGSGTAGTKVVLHYNPLWTTSKRRDLQTEKAASFNHPGLVPQFFPKISSYDATTAQRLSRAIDCRVPFLNWTDHVFIAYFQNQRLAPWSVANPYRDPVSEISLVLPQPEPSEPSPPTPWQEKDPQRLTFDWVPPAESLQWSFFKKSLSTLKSRGSDVFVLIGPFNEHLLTDESRTAYRKNLGEWLAWLASQDIPCLAPEPLSTELYADASHPIRGGYVSLAQTLLNDAAFASFITP